MNKAEKKTLISKLEKKFHDTADKLGMPIDEGIFDTIVILNALELTTFQSCAGHTDHGTYAPYIDIMASKKILDIQQLEFKTRDKADILNESLDIPSHQKKAVKLYDKAHLYRLKKIKLFAEEAVIDLLDYLDEFYLKRKVPNHQKIILQGFSETWVRIESQGAMVQPGFKEKKRNLQLAKYQNEMEAFTKFLKNKFYDL